jgi:hypothetical protein
VTLNVERVAPMMLKHGPVGDVHFFHWYVNVIGNEPAHDPFDTERKSPMFGVPLLAAGMLITGYTVFVGATPVPGTDVP